MAGGVDVRATSLRVVFTFEGKQHRPTLFVGTEPMAPTPANIRFATRLAAEVRDKIRLGVFDMAQYAAHFGVLGTTGTTLAEQLDAWLACQRIEVSTTAGYRTAIRFWSTAPCDDRGTVLGTLPLRSLRLSHFLRALASRPALTGKGVNNYVSVLHAALDLAVADGSLQANPADGVPRAKHQSPPPDPFSAEERDAILQSLAERHPGQVHNLAEFWFWTGMRTSEVFGLTWSNVDLAAGKVLVSEARVRGLQKQSTKTDTARLVSLNSRALAAIQRQRPHTQMAGAEVFQDPRYSATWNDERAWRRSFWAPTLRLLGIRYRRPYNKRHTYATAMLMAGMTPAFCAKQLGHSVEMFLKTYAKWIDGAASDREMARLESSLSPNYPQKELKAP